MVDAQISRDLATIHKTRKEMLRSSSSLTTMDDTGGSSSSLTTMEDTGGSSSSLTTMEDTGGSSSSLTNMDDTGGSSSSLTTMEDTGGSSTSFTTMDNAGGSSSSLTAMDDTGGSSSSLTTMEDTGGSSSSLTTMDDSGGSSSSLTTMEDTGGSVLQIDSTKNIHAYTIKQAKDSSYLTCHICNKVFSRTWLLKNHVRVHTGERPYKCLFCDKAFADKSNLRQHMKIHTTKEKLFQCGICKRTFAQRRYLAKHVSEIHRQSSLDIDVMVPPSNKKHVPEVNQVIIHQDNTTIIRADSLKGMPNKSADHQHFTRQKSKGPGSDAKAKYSEQDLKDFIKSSSRTMEKNGYMFIKHNFVSMDTEPSLTEISETGEPKVQTESSPPKPLIVSKMVPVQTTNGKVVYKKDSKSSQTVLLQSPQKSNLTPKTTTLPPPLKRYVKSGQGQGSKVVVMDKNNQIIANSASPMHSKPSKILQTGTKNVQYVQPVQLVQTSPPGVKNSAVPGGQSPTFLQVLPQGGMPVMGGGPIQLIPVTLTSLSSSILVPQTVNSVNSGLNNTVLIQSDATKQPISQPIITNTNQPVKTIITQPHVQYDAGNNEHTVITMTDQPQPHIVSSSNIILSSDNQQQHPQSVFTTVKPDMKTHFIDEKGDAVVLAESHTPVQTPIVSDAPWQGVLNINSEQELLDFINSQSQSVIHSTGLDGDKGMTIYIQNVDPNIGTITPLAVDVLQEPFSDQGTIMSEVLPVSEVMPVSSNMEEVSLNPGDGGLLVENSVLLHGDPTPSSIVSVEDGGQLSISESVFNNDNPLSVNPGVEDEALKMDINGPNEDGTEILYTSSVDNVNDESTVNEGGLTVNEEGFKVIKSEGNIGEVVFASVSDCIKQGVGVTYTESLEGTGLSNVGVSNIVNENEGIAVKEEIDDTKDFYQYSSNDQVDNSETITELHQDTDESNSELPDEQLDQFIVMDVKNTDHDMYSVQIQKNVTIETVQDKESESAMEIGADDENDSDAQNSVIEGQVDEVDDSLHVDLKQDTSDDNLDDMNALDPHDIENS